MILIAHKENVQINSVRYLFNIGRLNPELSYAHVSMDGKV